MHHKVLIEATPFLLSIRQRGVILSFDAQFRIEERE
jgi:hypothetical protein